MTGHPIQDSDHERALEEEIAAMRSETRDLKQALADHKHSLKVARRRLHDRSFLKELESYKEYIEATSSDPRYAALPTRGMTYKLRTYEQVASHGFAIPTIYAVWENTSSLDLDALPESFVLKSDGGSTSKGVLPLRRSGPDAFLRADGLRTLSSADVKEHFDNAYANGDAYGALFAEELLYPADGSTAIPNDVKIYTAYGTILQALLRHVDEHGLVSETRSKYVDERGSDLGAVATHRTLDPNIAVPSSLPEMVEIARHLSRASGLPFCRVDLYDTTKGVIVGEITRAPGGAQTYVEAHDRLMGQLWHLAEAELQLDLQQGRPAGLLWGDNSYPPLYATVRDSISRDHEKRTTVKCSDWCLPK